ncbi:MAG: hypothetical protein IJV07_03240 [Alphaproteobacteria bacterium]|nr:hypothetical protein [Alphaproteobacteria bacterium]
MKKQLSALLLLFSVVGMMPISGQASENAPVLVCRSHQCAYASYSMTKGFLYNKIVQMMEQNVGKTVLVCEADPVTHVCLQEGISIPSETAFNPIDITVQNLKLVDKKLFKNADGIELALDYRLKADDTFPQCQLGMSQITVAYADKVEMGTDDFICNITGTGRSALNATYNIDYLDFDYGYMGAHYTIAVGEAVRGDKTGYALFRFTARPDFSQTVDDAATDVQSEEMIDSQTTGTGIDSVQNTVPSTMVTETTVRVVPEFVSKPTPEVVAQPNRVVKTTTIERMVITPDGSRRVTPPETRTIIDGVLVNE